ncbi:MAG TPA: tetratricopeptide repeat protein [Planctomycetaceae bacterium]|nr:tetratricopeptide repeat protein [Planctomycetaceae bacterium]
MKPIPTIPTWLVLGISLVFGLQYARAESAGSVPAILEQAALARDWKGVVQYCESNPKCLKSPAVRALLAHACLALNQNDKSLELLQSIGDEAKRREWQRWTQALVKRLPKSAVARYFAADAALRSGRWQEALAGYDAAIRLDKTFAMAWNGRGVAHAYLGDFRAAKRDLKEACRLQPTFADAYASLGTLLVAIEAGPGSLQSYRLALQKSNEFSLVKIGIIIAGLGKSQDAETLAAALKGLLAAAESPPVSSLACANLESMGVRSKGHASQKNSPKSGMSLETRDMVHLDGETLSRGLRRMSTNELRSALDRVRKNADHSERWAGIWSSLNISVLGSGMDLTKWADNSWRDTAGWKKAERLIRKELERRGADPLAGGADTSGVALDQSSGDVGAWPAKKMWFGLLPNVDLPELSVDRPAR